MGVGTLSVQGLEWEVELFSFLFSSEHHIVEDLGYPPDLYCQSFHFQPHTKLPIIISHSSSVVSNMFSTISRALWSQTQIKLCAFPPEVLKLVRNTFSYVDVM